MNCPLDGEAYRPNGPSSSKLMTTPVYFKTWGND
jgi:hypothetical protein